MRTASSKRPTAIDRHIGARITVLRKARDMTQAELAGMIGVTTQQLQKYEYGVNRIGAAGLLAIARRLDVRIGYFFSRAPMSEPD